MHIPGRNRSATSRIRFAGSRGATLATLPPSKLYGELGLVNLVALIPSPALTDRRARRPRNIRAARPDETCRPTV
jgi:hypothetical protein